jgi:hypothetical protein
MILPGTYQNGFAPRDGEPLFPELWDGCVGAWNPGLGPTGLTLRDWSPYKNHGKNSSPSTAFSVVSGRYAFSGGFSTIASNKTIDNVRSVALWLRPATVSGFFVAASRDSNLGAGRSWYIARSNATLNIAVWNDSGTLRNQSTGNLLTANRWHHVVFSWDGVNVDIFVDGNRQVLTNTLSGLPRTVVVDLKVNALGNNGFTWTGSTDDLRLYSEPIKTLIPLLASRRGIAYELAPRGWTQSQIAAYRARYYSQLIGGGVI